MVNLNLKNIFADIPPLSSQRLLLRKILPSDYSDMYEYASNEKTTQYLSWEAHRNINFTKNYTKFLQKQYRDGNFYDWAVVIKETGKMIGTCGFSSFSPENCRAELGYVISPDYWGKGIATEAANLVISFGFEQLDLHRIEAKFICGNFSSEAVMKKIGMKKEGVFREYMFIKGDFKDICYYAMTVEDYFKIRYNI